MPFKSEKQRKWMWANEPEIAEEWEEKEKNEIKIMKLNRRQLRRIIREARVLSRAPESMAWPRGGQEETRLNAGVAGGVLRGRIQEEISKYELEEYGLQPGARVVLREPIGWLNRGGLENSPELKTAWLLKDTEVEVGNTDGERTEVYDLARNQLFTVRTSDLVANT